MNTLSTRTAADDAELARLERELTRRWADLAPPVVREWHDTGVLTLARETPWWVGPAECDPQRDHRGRLAVPREARARLDELAAHRIPFRRIAVAHELDPEGPVRDLLPALRNGPLACSEATALQVVGRPPAHPTVTRAARLLERVVGGASAAADRFAGAVVDPIVFGVLAVRVPEPGDVTLWVPLVVWRW